MVDKITLLLILHNRHKNLDRLLKYYDGYDFPILVADSSAEPHHFTEMKPNWNYIYTPNIFFTKKLETVLPEVRTPYVLMCADDDFIIPKSILECVSFLEQNTDYAIAQGLAIQYDKESIQTGKIRYRPTYTTYQSVEDDDDLKRLFHFFKPYRSILYAVFRTEILQHAFTNTGQTVRQLFLNEYITAFLPIQSGKYKELPILYQVREYASDSDDKTAIDLDKLTREKQYTNDVDSFIDLMAKKTSHILALDFEEAKKIVASITYDYAGRLYKGKKYISPKKRIGKIIHHLPLIGKWLVKKNRDLEKKQRLSGYFNLDSEREELHKISVLLKKYDAMKFPAHEQ